MVQFSAWILPGISGSFVLLLLGLYTDVIAAVNALDWRFLTVLACGCASGLLLFTRVLGWLLHRYHDALLAMLTGFMSTALVKLWLWQTFLVPANNTVRANCFLICAGQMSMRWKVGRHLCCSQCFAGSAGGSAYGCCPDSPGGDGKKVCQRVSMDECVIPERLLGGLYRAWIAGGKSIKQRASFNQTTYTVVRGDTLYSIAWRFDFDYRRLAAANKIGPPYTIYPGQVLGLKEKNVPTLQQSERRRRWPRLPATYSTKSHSRNAKASKTVGCAPVRAAAVGNKVSAETGRSRCKNLVSAAAVKPLRCLEKNNKGRITRYRQEQEATRITERCFMQATASQVSNAW